MRGPLLVAEFLATPWSIERQYLATISGVVARWSHGLPRADSEDYVQARSAREARRPGQNIAAGGVAVIPIYGAIMQRANMLNDFSGGTSTQQLSADLTDALADDAVRSILLDIDSPGGSVFGIQELADEIRAANAKKPVVAIANSTAASAAYWLGSQASEFYVTPSGCVGSIGVYMAHEDYSKALEEIGIKTTLVSAGKYKTELADTQPLGAEAQAHLQAHVDSYYQAFTRGVARGRNVPVASVRGGMGQGRILTSQDAVAAGMVDGVKTYALTMQRARHTITAGPKASYALVDGRELDARRIRAENRRREIDLLEQS